jgi:tRNA A37 threonylcarbamoyladenosine modification protein TsaB
VSQDVRRGEFFFGLFENGQVASPPRAMSQEHMEQQERDAQIETVHDVQVDTRILAWLAMDSNPEEYPAEPLYSRGPDAKLPGGRSLSE